MGNSGCRGEPPRSSSIESRSRRLYRTPTNNFDSANATKSDTSLDPVKRFLATKITELPTLERAQRATTTKLGLDVNRQVTANILDNRDVENLAKAQPEVASDIRLILNPPFSEMSRITDTLFLTGIGGLTKQNFANLQIQLIVNATYELPIIETQTITSVRVPIDDDCEDDISVYFHDVSDLIESATAGKFHTVVHCAAGASRSTTLVIAYLIKYSGLTLREAFRHTHTGRQCARPNMGFFEQLIRFEYSVLGKNSVHMAEYSIRGVKVKVPSFYREDYPALCKVEENKQVREQIKSQSLKTNWNNSSRQRSAGRTKRNHRRPNSARMDFHYEIINMRETRDSIKRKDYRKKEEPKRREECKGKE